MARSISVLAPTGLGYMRFTGAGNGSAKLPSGEQLSNAVAHLGTTIDSSLKPTGPSE